MFQSVFCTSESVMVLEMWENTAGHCWTVGTGIGNASLLSNWSNETFILDNGTDFGSCNGYSAGSLCMGYWIEVESSNGCYDNGSLYGEEYLKSNVYVDDCFYLQNVQQSVYTSCVNNTLELRYFNGSGCVDGYFVNSTTFHSGCDNGEGWARSFNCTLDDGEVPHYDDDGEDGWVSTPFVPVNEVFCPWRYQLGAASLMGSEFCEWNSFDNDSEYWSTWECIDFGAVRWTVYNDSGMYCIGTCI